MGKPQLPRRRAQEHIAPQLRDGPTPRQDSEYSAGHDPGLMAAFQRGIGLAEAQQHVEAAPGDTTTSMAPTYMGPVDTASPHTASTHTASTHTASPHAGPVGMGTADVGPVGMGTAHMWPVGTDAPHMAPTDRRLTEMGLTRTDASDMEPSDTASSDTLSSDRWATGTRSSDMEFGHTGPTVGVHPHHADATDMTPAPSLDVRPLHPLPTDQPRIAEARPPHASASREARGVRGSGAAPGHDLDLDHHTRHDGSAPAG
ncbi:hypothetical protein SALBM311S_04259 [Streptomyces alboniger]